MQTKRNSWRCGVYCLIFVIWLSVTRKNTEYKHVWKQNGISKCSYKTTKKCCKAELIQRLMLYSLPLKSVLKKEPGHP